MNEKQKASAVLDYLEEQDSEVVINILQSYVSDESLAALYDKMKEEGISVDADDSDDDTPEDSLTTDPSPNGEGSIVQEALDYVRGELDEDELLGIEDESEKVMVLYEVDEEDNTKTSVVAMTEADWNKRKPETIEKVLREYFDERYADCDDEYFCYEEEIKQAVAELSTDYETEFNGSPLFWDSVEMIN